MGPFLVTTHIGEVAYHLDLKGQFTHVQPVFHELASQVCSWQQWD